MKLKNILIFAAVSAIILSGINTAGLTAAASQSRPSLTVDSVSISPSTVTEGDTFRVDVTVGNNETWRLGDIVVSAVPEGGNITASGALTLPAIMLEGLSSSTVSFYFEAAGAGIGQIRFKIERNKELVSELLSTVNIAAAPEPSVQEWYGFEIITELYSPSSKKVSAGDNIRMGIRFANIGADSRNVSASLAYDEKAFKAVTIPLHNLGIMLDRETAYIDFNFTVADNAENGLYRFDLKIEAANSRSFEYVIGITVDNTGVVVPANEPDLKFIDIELPENIKRGEFFTLSAVIENTGAEAREVSAEIKLPAGLESTSHDSVRFASLEPAEKRTVSFELVALEDAARSNWHRITLTASCKDSSDEQYEFMQHTGLNILADEAQLRDLSLSLAPEVPDSVVCNKDFKFIFTIKNNGEKTEENFMAVVNIPAGAVSKTASSFRIPELKAGESISREVTIMALEAAAGKSLVFDIEVFDLKQSAVIFVENLPEEGELGTDLTIENIKIPAFAGSGERFEVLLTAANIGETELRNISFAVTSPAGMIIRGSEQETIKSLAPGERYNFKIEYTAPQTGSGYQAFKAELTAGEIKTTSHFGTVLNSSDLRIESIKSPASVGIERDFSIEVAIKNTGAAAQNVKLSLAPQAGLVGRSQNPVIINRIEAGETVVRTFTFRALASAPDAFVPIAVTLTNGEETIEQVTGTNVINPPEDEKTGQTEKTDMPVVIISRFSYENIESEAAETAETAEPEEYDEYMPGDFGTGFDIFEPSGRIMIESVPAPAFRLPGVSDGGTAQPGGGSARSVQPANIDTHAVFGGSSFMFTLEIMNMHREVAVRDLKITITSDPRATQPGGIFNPKAGSNTFFVEHLGPGATAEESIELLVRSDAVPDSYGLTVSLSYRNE
ncbi:MAG: hypothetical protein FWH24_06130, partial [Oscillospiraceae bacterium]|nr:hypothetical protein [Oscillospiraceae bacterium]